NDSPVYSDFTTLTVVFPDVAVGDTVALSYRLTQTDPLFPGHYSVAQTLFSQVAFDEVRVKFDYPNAMWVQYGVNGMRQVDNSERGGRKTIEWTYANPQPVKRDRKNFSVYDPEREVGFSFTTFKTYAEIASAYGAKALPKAAVTERITKLAADIVKDKAEPREQARALYEWVAKNITYAGNCIGIGAVVPRDVSFILDNKMGDCKDHATLLQALLTARGIGSTQALVNAGPVYKLPKIPVVSNVNHVINYIPAFDLFVDSTSDSTPFGMLPFQVEDKPVLLVEGFRDGLKTPIAPIGSNRQLTRSVLSIGQDGSVAGSVEVTQKGVSAVQSRAWARQVTKEWEADLVKNIFLQQGMIGSGKFEKDDPTALADDYRYKAEFNVTKFLRLPGSGAFYIYPLINNAGSIQNVLNYPLEPETEADVACTSGALTEEYEISLPKTIKILSIPDDLAVANDFLTYTSTYRLDGSVLKIKREVNDRTQGNVCSPKVLAHNKEIGEKIMDDLKSQVLYK
ncbi:MAG: DUF3857 domain-containing protein, partial [Betaproteobacteria bacterium]